MGVINPSVTAVVRPRPHPFLRFVVTVSSWFKVPEQGMKDYEFLSRGSAFCIKPPPGNQAAPRSIVFVTCSHVIAPYRWQEHFRESWLRYVNDNHIKCRIEVWEKCGQVLKGSLPVASPVLFHPTLDFCSFRVEGSSDSSKDILHIESFTCNVEEAKEGQDLTILGFPITAEKEEEKQDQGDENDVRRMEELGERKNLGLRAIHGKALGQRDNEGRCYVRTEERVAIGMSGGPVVDRKGRCRGIFQGMVPPSMNDEGSEEGRIVDPSIRSLQADWELHAGYIPSKYIISEVFPS